MNHQHQVQSRLNRREVAAGMRFCSGCGVIKLMPPYEYCLECEGKLKAKEPRRQPTKEELAKDREDLFG